MTPYRQDDIIKDDKGSRKQDDQESPPVAHVSETSEESLDETSDDEDGNG